MAWRSSSAALACLLGAACAKDAISLGEVRARLAQRDAAFAHYHLAGKTDGQTYTFDFRAPNRMRGTLMPPANRTFSFDGKTLYELADRTLTIYENELPPEKSAEFLTRIFSPFVPEGIRAPLFPSDATVGREAQWVRIRSKAGTLTLRWDAMDFVERRIGDVVIRVTRESCDAKRCVPTEVSTSVGGAPGPVTTLTETNFEAVLPLEEFTLEAGDGGTVVHRRLTPASEPSTAPGR